MSNLIDTFGRTSEERTALAEKVAKANEEARTNWGNPQWRHAMAQELTETIYRGFEHENLLSLFTNVENAPFDGRVFVKEVRGLKAFWVSRGGYIEASEIKSEVMEIPRDTIGFHVFEFEDKLRSNFSETAQSLVSLAQQRMDAQVNQRMFSLFQAAVPSSSAYYSSGSGLSLSGLNTALREVRDESMDGQVTIIGRSTMTEQIIDELLGASSNGAGFLPETNEALVKRGVLGTYRSAKIVTLKNYDDDNRVPFFPANELWVVGRDASKFAFWGGLLNKEYVEPDNWYWHYLARRDFGGVVHRPERLRRIVDTSIAASTPKGS